MDDPGALRAERAITRELARFHRRDPLRPDVRIDSLLASAAGSRGGRSVTHRGAAPIADAQLAAALDRLVERGTVERRGRRIRLTGATTGLGPQMRGRADELVRMLAAGGAAPPRVNPVARRLGLPPAVVDGLRAAGEIVEVAPGIDYAPEVLEAIVAQLTSLSPELRRPGSVARELHVPRRHAAALLTWLAARDRKPVR